MVPSGAYPEADLRCILCTCQSAFRFFFAERKKIMTEFLKGSDYPWICPECQSMTDRIVQLFQEDILPDTADPEAPAMYMYDHSLYCGGSTCVNGEKK